MVYKRPPYLPSAAGFGDDDAAFLARNGFDVVRLGVIYAAVEPSPGVYDDAYLANIYATVRTLAAPGQLGVYISWRGGAHEPSYTLIAPPAVTATVIAGLSRLTSQESV